MRAKGSYTVEAALIMPIVLGCILLVLNQSIELYTEVTKATVYTSWWQEKEPAEDFRKIELLRKAAETDGEE